MQRNEVHPPRLNSGLEGKLARLSMLCKGSHRLEIIEKFHSAGGRSGGADGLIAASPDVFHAQSQSANTARIPSPMANLPEPRSRQSQSGQALVEFTLVFVLLLVIAWIPADFGLAFFSGQLASNAAREGARIGSASPTFNAATIATETCRRLPSALLSDPGALTGFVSCSPYSNAKVRVELLAGSGTCNQTVRVTVAGNYNYFFFRLMRLMGLGGNFDDSLITRRADMRWEHQC